MASSVSNSRPAQGLTGNGIIRQQLKAGAAAAPSPEGRPPSWGPAPSPADRTPRGPAVAPGSQAAFGKTGASPALGTLRDGAA